MKYLLIVNPAAGRRSHEKNLRTIREYFRRHRMPLDVVFTGYPGHAIELARQACREDYDVIIGAGGDGTINEVLNGLAGSDVKMAIIPWGTGNVFTLEMNFPRRLTRICRLIRKGRFLRLDTAVCNGRRFLLMCGAGFDAYSLKQMSDPGFKRTAGLLAYVAAGLKAFTSYTFPEIEAVIDGGIRDRGSYVLVSNTSRYGAYFTLTHRAVPVDGELDVLIYREFGRWNLLRLFFRIILSAFRKHFPGGPSLFMRKLAVYKTRSVILRSRNETDAQLDGELFGTLPLSITVDPLSVSIILPKKTIRRYDWIRRIRRPVPGATG